MKTILFDVSTPYQLLVASFICINYYESENTILLLNRTHLSDALCDRVGNVGIFSIVKNIDDSANFSDISMHMDTVVAQNIDIYHFSSFSSVFSCYLYNRLHNSTEIILTEEGAATYNLYKNYDVYLQLYRNSNAEKIELDNLSKIWVFNKALYMSKFDNKVQEISCKNGFDLKSFVNKINSTFDYNFTLINEKAIFFSQNFLDYHVISMEEYTNFVQKLYTIFQNSLVIKAHPMDKFTHIYKDCGFEVLDQTVPWEVIVLNHVAFGYSFDKILLSVGSTSLVSDILFLKFFDICFKKVLLCEILQTPFNETIKDFYAVASQRTAMEYSLPSSYEQLHKIQL